MSDLLRRRAEALEGTVERRTYHAAGLELRETGSGLLHLTGHASVTETPYDFRHWVETIARGAFRRTLSESPDVVLLINHGEGGGLPLARTKSGTLRLSEDDRGLRVDADLDPDDPDVRTITPKLRRGDLSEMSMGFKVTGQDWSEDSSRRRITSLGLHKGDVSLVTFGANDATSASLRSRPADVPVRWRAPDEYTERWLRLEATEAQRKRA